MAGRIAVVDNNNRFVRWEERRVIHEQRLVHRSVHIFLFDRAGRLLLQKRHHEKQTFAGYWDTAVSGHVEESDYPGDPDADLDNVYRSVAEREMREELGVWAALSFVGHFSPEPGLHYEQFHFYVAEHNGPFVLQPDEVVGERWVTGDELVFLSAQKSEPLTPVVLYLANWLTSHGLWP